MTALLIITGYPSPKTGEWVGGLRPRTVDYTTVYFVKDLPKKFRGIDLNWYGPFTAGQAANIPIDDAEFWIRKGYASYTPPAPTVMPTEIPGLSELTQAIRNLNSTMTTKIESVSAQIQGLSGQISTITAVAAIEGVAIILLAIALVAVRKKSA